MGNCLHSPPPLTLALAYPSHYKLTVITSDQTSKRVKVHLKPPEVLETAVLKLGRALVTTASCVIAGMNVRVPADTQAQDAVFTVGVEGAMLAGVLDGHSREGRKVVEFCSEWFQSYFKQHWEEFRADARRAMAQAFERCDAAVKLEVECVLSGSTAVLIYLTETSVTVASVGSAKAVLATLPTGSSQPQQRPIVSASAFHRTIEPTRALDAVEVSGQITVDSEEELMRIASAGGRVMRVSNGYGEKAGPYRVWQKAASLPGLAYSRSLCDKMAAGLGVIPTPIVKQFQLFPHSDLFFVLASDGLWYPSHRHMFSPQEAVDFIEKFRRQCSKSPSLPVSFPVRVPNTSVSHLLCEEARVRWLGVVQNEEVCMDDISCLVLELEGGDSHVEALNTRFENDAPALGKVEEGHGQIYAPEGADPLRNSLIPVSQGDKRMFAVRKDAKRGSVARPSTS